MSLINGTSANLIEGDTLSILELMYGMMLPSGNDASVALGVHFGGIIKHGGKKDPEVVITQEAIERRLRAQKIVAARNYREQIEQSMRDDLNSEQQANEQLNQTQSDSMKCKQLFTGFGTPYKRTSGMQKLK